MTTAFERAKATLAVVEDAPHVVTIGNFDGVHRGHQYLIDKVRTAACERGAKSLAITFEPHPVAVLRPDRAPDRIATPSEKLRLLRATGLDDISVIEFTREFSTLTPDEFLDLLLSTVQPVEVFVGEGFRFGKGRAGDCDTIRQFGETHGFDTTIVARLHDDDAMISSSNIRGALRNGDVAEAERCLGRRYRLLGTVEHGEARGRELGFPTANLTVNPTICIPADGIYAALAHLPDGQMSARKAIVYIGTRPTFDNDNHIIEAYILDFNGDLYTQELEIEFVAHIRGDQAFDSAEQLIEQMNRDEQSARAILENV
ncbi:MAG: bifunctional riboflavin kinase/FAD synthetase [Thermomicrobiales bacterium]|nr:bifunctional riboflavin kinase/FAD synthetase [Thermomicrobiales bacterium]